MKYEKGKSPLLPRFYIFRTRTSSNSFICFSFTFVGFENATRGLMGWLVLFDRLI
jgi:hypothetical protein